MAAGSAIRFSLLEAAKAVEEVDKASIAYLGFVRFYHHGGPAAQDHLPINQIVEKVLLP